MARATEVLTSRSLGLSDLGPTTAEEVKQQEENDRALLQHVCESGYSPHTKSTSFG